MTYRFHPDAQAELYEAADAYEACSPGLGAAFRDDVYAAIQRSLAFPALGSPLTRDFRRCLTHRFPFGVIYKVNDDHLLIIAVAHLKRKPGYWRERLHQA